MNSIFETIAQLTPRFDAETAQAHLDARDEGGDELGDVSEQDLYDARVSAIIHLSRKIVESGATQ